jgi:hypothetical protein
MSTFDTNLMSMDFVRQTPPNESTVTLTWRIRVLDAQGAEIQWDPFTYWLSVQTEVPETGRKLTGYLPNTTANDWSAYFRCRQVTWRFVGESKRVWDATATFTSKDAWCPHPHVWRTDQTQTRSVEMYRDVYPTAAQLNSTASQHTVSTGNRIDEKGKPVPRQLPQQLVNVSYIWNTSIETEGPGYPNVANLISEGWLDARNDAEFLGFPAGSVRLLGVSIDPDRDEYVRVTYQFLHDPWGFMVQEAALDPGGAVELETTGAVVNAKTVYWKQSIVTLLAFDEFLTQLETDWLVDGWQTYDAQACTPSAGATTYTGKPREAQIGTVSEFREYPVEAQP